jgi:hypothetical protein
MVEADALRAQSKRWRKLAVLMGNGRVGQLLLRRADEYELRADGHLK